MGERSKPVELATRSFEKQGDAIAFFKAMLNRYRPGERVNDDDTLDVAVLLERHTEYVVKVGSGVSHFQVMMTEHGTQCHRSAACSARGSALAIASPYPPPRSRATTEMDGCSANQALDVSRARSGKQSYRPSPLKVADHRPIGLAAPEGEIVDPDDA